MRRRTGPEPRRAARCVARAAWIGMLSIGTLLIAQFGGARGYAAQDDDGPPPAHAQRKLARVESLVTTFPIAAHRILDVDGDGRDDLLAIGRAGEVRVWHWDQATGRAGAEPSGVLVLPEPDRSVLAIADLLGTGGRPQLCVVSRRGLEAYPVGTDGAFARAPVLVSKEVSLSLRVGEPTFANVLRDVNGDGRPDLILPRGETCELWLATAPAVAGAPPAMHRVGAFKVDVQRDHAVEAGALSDVLESSFRIPPLSFRDVNGDGRKDLVVEDGKIRAFHLARPDGTIAPEPDVRKDLSEFQDTTPAAEVRLGRTLAGGDDQRFDSTDLDGDGIPDYVISHRRKVWVFRGSSAGPQFTEAWQVLRVADDVSAMLVARLDGDPKPDLLLLRAQVPTVTTLLRGLVASWDVEIASVGYENVTSAGDAKGPFATAPKWKGDLALRLPAILGILKDPEALVKRFETLEKKLKRGFVWGDFDGDGRADAAVATQAERHLDVWFGVERGGAAAVADDADIGSVFFGTETTWDIERVLQWLGDYADRRFAKVTGSRDPSLRAALRPAAEAELQDAGVLSDGAGKAAAIVVAYTDEAGQGVFDVWR
ncbi:MAG: VCBS repeat-containing protein [Planctomycetes bacterium]|nr:VCBS repeat-containing protein [Planctomycetota bacterium]